MRQGMTIGRNAIDRRDMSRENRLASLAASLSRHIGPYEAACRFAPPAVVLVLWSLTATGTWPDLPIVAAFVITLIHSLSPFSDAAFSNVAERRGAATVWTNDLEGQRLFGLAGIGVWRRDHGAPRAVWSPEARDMFGLDSTTPSREEIDARIHEDDRADVLAWLAAGFAGGPVAPIEHRIRHPVLGIRRIRTFLEIKPDVDHAPHTTWGIMQDVTDGAPAFDSSSVRVAMSRELDELVGAVYGNLAALDDGSLAPRQAALVAKAKRSVSRIKGVAAALRGLGIRQPARLPERAGPSCPPDRQGAEPRPGSASSVGACAGATEGTPPAVRAWPQRADGAPELRLLLVEDDAAVRDVAGAMLRRAGIAVVAVGTGHEALVRLGAGEGVDCLMVDLGLPDISGLDVVERARDLRPGLPSLITSGYADPERTLGRKVPAGVPLLCKPFRSRELLAAISGLLPPDLGPLA